MSDFRTDGFECEFIYISMEDPGKDYVRCIGHLGPFDIQVVLYIHLLIRIFMLIENVLSILS